MRPEGIATAACRDPSAAKSYITGHGAPIVVKADALAAGKEVVVATPAEVDAALLAAGDGALKEVDLRRRCGS